MIQKRDSALETNAHTHLINAHEQQLRQPQVKIQVRHPVQIRLLPCLFCKTFSDRLHYVPRSQVPESPLQIKGNQPALLSLSEDLGTSPKYGLPASCAAKQFVCPTSVFAE